MLENYQKIHTKLMEGDLTTNNRPKLKKGSQNYFTYSRLCRGEKLNSATEASHLLIVQYKEYNKEIVTEDERESARTSAGTRLPNRVNDLRKLGVPIKDRIVNKVNNVKEYWLDEKYLSIFTGDTHEHQ